MPYFLVVVILVAAILLPIEATLIALTFCAGMLVLGNLYLGPLDGTKLALQLSLLGLVTALTFLAHYPQKTMIVWAWQGYEEARLRLEESRDRQVKLERALEDLALANKETQRLNMLLAAARQAVEEARRAKEEFVANVSHELRTPLNMIIGFSDLILESPEVYAQELPTALLADVAAIKRNSEHLANLVDDVLSLAEVDAGRMRLSPETITVQDLASEAARIVGPFFAQKGLFLKMEVPNDLPPIYADRLRLRQVLLNLLTNAARFTDQGGATIKATLGPGLIEVRVSDTGPGISQEALSKLFEPFKQADSSIRRRYGGTGLGLALSKRFVELHGGKIWIESAPGQGTTVIFTLPIEPPVAETPRRWFSPYHEYTPRERSGATPIAKGKPCVVVLERGEVLPKLMHRYLDTLEPLQVKDWAEAQAAVEAHGAVALLVNEATVSPAEHATLARFAFDIPILRCNVPQPQPPWATPQIVDYLVKPIQREVLLEKVRGCGNGIRTILLADDDPEARQLFGRILASAENGYRVLYAMDGRSTLEMLRERHPDLLLLDLVMPNGDGFFVLETMNREQGLRHIPVIIISALDVDREPITSRDLVITRQQGLSARELMLSLQALTEVLAPRFGAPKPPTGSPGSPACG